MNYYTFSPDGKECVIHRTDMEVPWLNLLTNDVFQAWVTHNGHFECLMLDRDRNSLSNLQENSGFLYLRDRESKAHFLLNRPGQGVDWHAKHGLGYTTIHAAAQGLTGSVTYFVPREDHALILLIRVKNHKDVDRTLDMFATVEWSLGDTYKSMSLRGHGGGGPAWTGASQFNLYKRVRFEHDRLVATQSVWPTFRVPQTGWPYVGVFSSSRPVESFDTLKSRFLGQGRSVENPEALEVGRCSSEPIWGTNEFPWGVLHHRIDIGAHAEEHIVLTIGMGRSEREIERLAEKYRDLDTARRELSRVKEFWAGFVDEGHLVHTPEPSIDRVINIWSKYQWRSSMMKNMNHGRRSLGFWSYGFIGGPVGGIVREVAVQPHDLDIVRESVQTFLRLQYKSSRQRGKLLEFGEPLLLHEDLKTTWPPPAPGTKHYQVPHAHEVANIHSLCDYVKETQDLCFLDEKVPYLDGDEETVYDHICRAVDYSLSGLSDRGLARLSPRIGDWNDELNSVSRHGVGESVMLTMEIAFTLKVCAEMADAYGKSEQASEWMEHYHRIKEAVNRIAWDGQWYVRAFADGGEELTPIGSAQNEEGKIFLNAQSWAVLSGIAEGERATGCMEAVARHLMTPYGPRLYAPDYTSYDEQVGVMSLYSPGWRTGGVFPRPVGWAVMAACLANRAEQAFDMYRRASLPYACRDMDRFQHEPYVYPETYVAPPHPLHGRAQYQWNLGEGANWMWHAYVYYILGVRPTFGGLLIDPKIPSDWHGFKVKRTFCHATFDISVANPDHVTSGVKSIRVDGEEISGNIVPVFSDRNNHVVEVLLGA